MKKTIFFLGTIVSALFGTSMRFITNNHPFSIRDLLTQSQWTSVHNYEDMDLDGTFKEFGKDCDKDDRWLFSPDGVCTQEEGLILCDTSVSPLLIKAGWTLQENDQFLVLDFELDEIKFYIQSINENKLIIEKVDIDRPGIYQYKIVLTR